MEKAARKGVYSRTFDSSTSQPAALAGKTEAERRAKKSILVPPEREGEN